MSEELDREFAGLSGPRGLGPGEKVPNELRILAMRENLGNLISVHRPATRFARLAFRSGRVYLYDKAFVVAIRGAGGLFRWDQCTVNARGGRVWTVRRLDGRHFHATKHWSDHEELGRAIEHGVTRAHMPD
jgi:hypothetical protein